MNKLFKTNLKKTTIPSEPDAEIIFNLTPYLQYQQIVLNDNYRTYLETTMISEHALRTGIKETPYQKLCELNTGIQSFIVDFRGADKQFSFLEISLV